MSKKLTNKKKNILVQDLKDTIQSFGFSINRWGNYCLQKDNKEFRFIIENINMKFQINCDPWLDLFKKRIIKLNPDKLTAYLTKRGFIKI